MLGKQGWKLLSDPEALVCKVLKAKYFPSGNFLNAKIGQSPSLTWSIWSSQVLLKRGIRWKIGDGSKVKVWGDPWLRDANNFWIATPAIPELSDLIVQDLFIPSCQQWDVELLNEFFNSRDVDAILNIPLSSVSFEDRHIWHFSGNGLYTVKIGYKLANSLESIGSLDNSGNWRKLWRLKIPPKIRLFAWRVCCDCLPTKLNLQRKGISVQRVCVLCNEALENIWYIFVSCNFAKRCWREAKMSLIVERCATTSESSLEWFFKMIDSLIDDLELTKFVTITWGIWKQRNCQLWDSAHKDAAATVFNALDYLYAWLAVKDLSFSPTNQNLSPANCSNWHCPPASYLKCNVDTAFFAQDKKLGVGMVLRNDNGDFLACRFRIFSGMVRVEEGEALGLHEALSWIRSMGFDKVIFEMDAKKVYDAIYSSSLDLSEFGAIIESCRRLLGLLPNCCVRFLGRKQNEIAHVIAKVSHS